MRPGGSYFMYKMYLIQKEQLSTYIYLKNFQTQLIDRSSQMKSISIKLKVSITFQITYEQYNLDQLFCWEAFFEN